MKFFYDTEFLERGPKWPVELISIGIVSEDGRKFYAINQEAPWTTIAEEPWLRDNVLKHLPGEVVDNGRFLPFFQKNEYLSRASICASIEAFLSPDNTDNGGQRPELWADCGCYDHVLIAQLWGRMIDAPKWFPYYTNDLRQFLKSVDPSLRISAQGANTQHHALWDAEWVRHAWKEIDKARINQ